MWECRYGPNVSSLRHEMKDYCQHYAPAALPPENEPSIPIARRHGINRETKYDYSDIQLVVQPLYNYTSF